MLKSGIYALTCITTGQSYVGSATSLEHRVKSHLLKLQKGKHKNKPLQECFNKYGLAGFEVKHLEECPVSALLDKERYWAKKLKAVTHGFNVAQLGSNGHLTHGMTHSKTFKSWESVLQRCNNPNAPDYPRWGGQGIKVCERWLKFENFYADMGERPEGTTIDRFPNRAGNYEPENCRWASAGEQQRNTKATLYLTIDGVERFLVDVADEKGIPRDLLRRRYHRGLTGNALFAPSYSRYRGDGTYKELLPKVSTRKILKFTAFGKTQSITEWAKELGLSRNCLSIRLRKFRKSGDCNIERYLVPEEMDRGPNKWR